MESVSFAFSASSCTCVTISKEGSRKDINHSLVVDHNPAMSVKRNRPFSLRLNSHLVQAFLLLSSVLLLLLPPCTSFPLPGERSSSVSAKNPSSLSIPESSTDIPHWVNPCNGSSSSAERSSSSDEGLGMFVNSIKMTCRQAIFQFEKFREAWVRKTFKVDLQQHHSHFQDMVYEWLTRDSIITKKLGETIPRELLDQLPLEDVATAMYGYLQRIAVGFEQIVLDQRLNNSDFKDEFIIAENNLRRVSSSLDKDFYEEFKIADNNLRRILCEVRELIPDDRLKNFENAKRDIMKNHRHMPHQTDQHIRDWLIFRDYMSLVEYIDQVMSFYDAKLNGNTSSTS